MLKLHFEYDFEFDDEGLDGTFVNIEGLAKDELLRSLLIDIIGHEITADDVELKESGLLAKNQK